MLAEDGCSPAAICSRSVTLSAGIACPVARSRGCVLIEQMVGGQFHGGPGAGDQQPENDDKDAGIAPQGTFCVSRRGHLGERQHGGLMTRPQLTELRFGRLQKHAIVRTVCYPFIEH